MSKDKKNKIRLPSSHRPKIDGFEDVIDIFIDEQEDDAREKNKKDVVTHSSSHELFDFLEKEKDRLESLDELFADKIPNMMNNPQIDILLKKQIETTYYKKEEVIKAIKIPNSDFLITLARLFDSSFS